MVYLKTVYLLIIISCVRPCSDQFNLSTQKKFQEKIMMCVDSNAL